MYINEFVDEFVWKNIVTKLAAARSDLLVSGGNRCLSGRCEIIGPQ